MKLKTLLFLFAFTLLPDSQPRTCAQDQADEALDESGDLVDGEELDEEGEKKPPEIVAPEKTDDTSAKIIELHLKGRGGLDALKAIKTLKIKGSLREGRKYYQMTWYRQAPNKYRVERKHHLMGKSHILVQAFDGTTAWSQDASPERKDPVVMPKKEAAAFILESDFHGPLVDWKEKGHKFLYVGEESLGERKVYSVKTFLKDGPVVYHYFDSKTFWCPGTGSRKTSVALSWTWIIT